MKKLFCPIRSLFNFICGLFKKTYTAKVCGHKTKLNGLTSSFGDYYKMSMPKNEHGSTDFCLECIGNMAIRCAWCGEPIWVGDPVTLYCVNIPFVPPKHAVRYDKDETCFVGCLRSGCCHTGADRQGFWDPPGEVYRVPSPIEMMMSVLKKGEKPQAIIIQDLSDPNDIGKVV